MRDSAVKMTSNLQEFAESFVNSTREYIFIRPVDNLLILRPNRVHFLNPTATMLLHTLYNQETIDVNAVIEAGAARYNVSPERIEQDLHKLLQSLSALLKEDPSGMLAVKSTEFGTHKRKYPVLGEIALTYRCQNRCFFCYASSPERGRTVPEMSTAEVKRVIEKIAQQAQVPTLSFTGGEPTLRGDLPELVAYVREQGLRVNLITNGIKCADADFVAKLADAGLHSAQVSLESGDAAIHDEVVAHKGAWARTMQGVRNLKVANIHTHTNTTINHLNYESLPAMIDMLAEMEQPYLSMNMLIRTGGAVGTEDINYSNIGEIVLKLKEHAEEREMRFVWYSPVPLCLFNPAEYNLGAPSCSAADGLLSIAPDGQVLPCSSFETGIGNLLHEDFETIWQRRAARYWRDKEFMPPGCRDCDLADLCCGACPLYWDEQGTFAEIEPYMKNTAPWARFVWRAKRRIIGQVKGVGV